MKVCPNCNKENPSAANYCMFCRTPLFKQENKPQDNLLKKERDVVMEITEQLKKSMAELQEKLDNAEINDKTINQLQKQISIRDNTINTLLSQINEQKKESSNLTGQPKKKQNKQKRVKWWWWIFISLWLIVALVLLGFGLYELWRNVEGII